MAEETVVNQGAPGGFEPADEPSAGESPLDATGEDRDQSAQRPELLVGAAFVGGFALAKLMKRMGG